MNIDRMRLSGLTLTILLLILCCLIAGVAEAADCPGTPVDAILYLTSQEAIDSYQANYGPCDRIAGSLEIQYVAGPGKSPITDLTPLNWLVEVGQALDITGGDFASLAGLQNLQTVGGSFTISGQPPITDLTGLSGLSSAGDLQLIGLSSLTSLSGLTNLVSVQSMRLQGLANLGSLSGLTSLTTVNYLWLTTVPSLTDLSGLPANLNVQVLSIEDTWELTSLNGLSTISGLEHVQLSGNQKLADLSGLASSTFAMNLPELVPSITIQFNLALTNLAGLPVGDKFGSIDIESNGNLSSLAGLENLVEIWGNVLIVDNPRLSDCSMLATVLDANDDGDPGPGDGINPDDPPDTLGLDWITISGNLAGCNTIGEIVGSADSQLIYMNGFEGGTP